MGHDVTVHTFEQSDRFLVVDFGDNFTFNIIMTSCRAVPAASTHRVSLLDPRVFHRAAAADLQHPCVDHDGHMR